MSRRFALTILLAASAAGCFALFPLDDYNEGQPVVDSGVDARPDAGIADASGDAADARPKPSLDGGQVLFVSSGTFTGDFGGLNGASNRCQEAATDAGLPGTYVAVLAVAGNPLTRFVSGKNPRPLIDTTARTVASQVSVLVESGPAIAIDRDEHGAPISFSGGDGGGCGASPAVTWTGAAANGSAAQRDCNEWNVSKVGQTGQVGLGFDKQQWLAACELTCDQKAHLYCLQQ